MASPEQCHDRFVGIPFEQLDHLRGRRGSLLAMSNPIHGGHQRAVATALNQWTVARVALSRRGLTPHTPLEQVKPAVHFFTVTVVPIPTSDTISNSSIRRLAPGSPRPRLPEVPSIPRECACPAPSSQPGTRGLLPNPIASPRLRA